MSKENLKPLKSNAFLEYCLIQFKHSVQFSIPHADRVIFNHFKLPNVPNIFQFVGKPLYQNHIEVRAQVFSYRKRAVQLEYEYFLFIYFFSLSPAAPSMFLSNSG